jgi:hypothetical protein
MSSVHNVDCRLYRICRLIQSVRQISGKSKPLQKITVFAVHLQHNTHAFSQRAVHDFAVNAGRWRNLCCTLCASQILAVRREPILQFRGWDFRGEITQLVECAAGVVATASVQEGQMVFLQENLSM